MSDIHHVKLRQLDFTLLIVLQSLLRHRQATAAAQELGLSPSAISHALARLRRIFGDPLFRRLPHGLEPTRHVLALSGRINALVRDGQEVLGMSEEFLPRTAKREFRVVAPDHLGTLLAAPLLKVFSETAPQSRFGLGVALGREALEELRRDRIDLALGLFLDCPQGCRIKSLYTERYVVVARRGHPKLKPILTKSAFEKLDHVAISVDRDFRVMTDAQFRQLGLSRHIVATVPRFTTAFETVSRTDAVAIAPERLARAQAKAFGLSMHALPIQLPPLHIVSVRRDHSDPGIDWFEGVVENLLS